ncbi:MAG TPA: Gfo/Idh/MocA family oxidoreductase [Abditibacteriaceae bacterium]|jgi:predicted dehydrogenase
MSKVKMAVLGCGGMSGEHARRFKNNADVEIVALCDVSEDVVNGYIEKNLSDYSPRPQVYTDAAQMYAEAKPDAVTIVTPHTMHADHGKQAVEAGCHVLMEKPMVTDSTQAKELSEAVEKAGKILVVGYNTPCTPVFNYIRDTIRSGELGKLEMVTGWQTQNWAKGTVGTWRQKPELSGGGQMYDSGAHMFNSLVWSVEQPIETVHAFADNVGTPVDINGSVNIRFTNGVMATMTIAGNCPTSGSRMTFIFDNGRIDCDGWGGSWMQVWKGGEEIHPELHGETSTPNENFIDAINGKAEARTSPINGVIQSQLMDAIYQSVESGQPASPKN